MLKSRLCDYSDANILFKTTIKIQNTAAVPSSANNTNKKLIILAPFTNCISKINDIQVDNAIGIDVVMPMYNLIEYSNNHSKTSGSLWQSFRDEPAVNCNGAIVEFNEVNPTKLINSKAKV